MMHGKQNVKLVTHNWHYHLPTWPCI